MKVNLIAIGTKMPGWVENGVREYKKRLSGKIELIVTEIPAAKRSKSNSDIKKICDSEGKALLKAVSSSDYVIALDVNGRQYPTEILAVKFRKVMEDSMNIALLVGGPDGLSKECILAANEIWSLSALTLPHSIVRIVVAEQIYRVWSVLTGHPYHRE